MSVNPPELDKRQASDLFAELKAIASTAVPEWKGDEQEGNFANALLRIVAQLGAHVSHAINMTPGRDQIAFFDMLDVPVAAPHPAQVPVVILLSDKQNSAVFAPARTQLAASTDDGEVLFETTGALQLTPAWLGFMCAVDGVEDSIELVPPGFLELAALDGPVLSYKTSSFSSIGSNTLQIEPAEGLAANDVIKVTGVAYTISESVDGLFVLKDKLEHKVDAGSVVEKITQFDVYTLRDQQQHILYIGHSELFKLEERTIITVKFEPPAVADVLASGAVRWELFSKIKSDDDGEEQEPEWYPLSSDPVEPGKLALDKIWRGTVEKKKINGVESHWLRARYIEKITKPAVEGTRVISIQIGAETSDLSPQAPIIDDVNGTDCIGGSSNAASTSASESEEQSTNVEGSNTIDQAFHNSTPLPLTTRFLPFGPEPQRFDTFALAAPEVFSKKGARVTLDVNLPDATVLAVEVAQTIDGPRRAYAIAENGSLQGLIFLDEITWQQLGSPEVSDLSAADENVPKRDLEFNGNIAPVVIELAPSGGPVDDLIVAVDKQGNGQFWTRVVRLQGADKNEYSPRPWAELPALPKDELPRDLVLLRRQTPSIAPAFHALLLVINDGKLMQLRLWLFRGRITSSSWIEATVTASPNEPLLSENSRLLEVQNNKWPDPKTDFPMEILVVDENDSLWMGEIDELGNVKWLQLEDDIVVPQKSTHTIKPAAARLSGGNLIVFAAELESPDPNIYKPFILKGDPNDPAPNMTLVKPPLPIELREQTVVRCFPSALSSEPLALFYGDVSDELVFALWKSDGPYLDIVSPDWLDISEPPNGLLFPYNEAGVPGLLVSGTAETLHRNRLAEPVQVELYDAFHATNAIASDYIEPSVSGTERYIYQHQPTPEINIGTDYLYRLQGIQVALEPLPTQWNLWDRISTHIAAVIDNVKLILPNGDASIVGDFLKIGDRLYRIASSTPDAGNTKLVELDPADDMVGPTVDYELVRQPAAPDDQVDVQYVRTNGLIKISDFSSPPEPPKGLFLNSTTPVVVPIESHWQIAGEEWILLASSAMVTTGVPVEAELTGVDTGLWDSLVFERGYQNPELAWEYYDGESWRRLESDFIDRTSHLAKSETISFTVPHDLQAGEIAGQEDYWIRARLVGGDYGRAEYIVETEGDPPTKQTITVNTDNLNPPEIIRIEASFKLEELVAAEYVLVQNNLDFKNQTQASEVQDAEFELYEGIRKINEAGTQSVLYFGLNKPFNVSPLSLYADAEDQAGTVRLKFEVLAEDGWRRVSHDDATQGFNRRGYVQVSVDTAPRKARLFARDLYWLRVRPANPVENWTPRLRGIYINAVQAEQAETIKQEVLGSSTGEPGLQFNLSSQPVLPDSLELRVLEILTDEEREELNTGSEELPEELKPVIEFPALSLNGDWVLWKRVDSFNGQERDARVYRLDPTSGVISFGRKTKTPPPGRDSIRAVTYQTGGGIKGNVGAYTIEAIKSAVEGVDTIANPVQAAGGTETPPMAAQIIDAPARIRRGPHTLAPADIEALAVSSSPLITRARCLFPGSPGDPIKLAIAVRDGERCPQPALAEREMLADLIHSQAWGGLFPGDIQVVGPQYIHISLQVSLYATSPGLAAALEKAATDRLRLLLHPIDGGPENKGWPFGRRIWKSDVYRALKDLSGFDRVANIDLDPSDRSIDLDNLPSLGLICALEKEVQLSIEFGSGGGP